MNKNKKLKKALSCSLALVVPVTTYIPSIMTVSAADPSSVERASNSPYYTKYETLKNHLKDVVNLSYDSMNISVLDSSTRDSLQASRNEILRDIDNSNPGSLTAYAILSKQCAKKIDRFLENYEEACNNAGIEPDYIKYKDMVIYNYDGNTLDNEGYLLDTYEDAAHKSDPKNILTSDIATTHAESFKGTNYTFDATVSDDLFPYQFDSSLVSEIADGKPVYPSITPIYGVVGGRTVFETNSENVLRDSSGNVTYHGIKLLPQVASNSSMPKYIIKDLKIEFNAGSNSRKITQTYYYQVSDVLYTASKETSGTGMGNFLSAKVAVAGEIEDIKTDLLQGREFASNQEINQYSFTRKRVVKSDTYGNEAATVEAGLASLELNIYNLINTNPNTYQSEVEKLVAEFRTTLENIPDKTQLEATVRNVSLTNAKDRLNEVEALIGTEAGSIPSKYGVQKLVTDTRNQLNSASSNDEICSIMTSFEEAFDGLKTNGLETFEAFKADYLNNKFTIDYILAPDSEGDPQSHTKDDYTQATLDEMQKTIDVAKSFIEEMDPDIREVLYTIDTEATNSASSNYWACQGYFENPESTEPHLMYDNFEDYNAHKDSICPTCGGIASLRTNGRIVYKTTVLEEYTSYIESALEALMGELKDENLYPVNSHKISDATKEAINSLTAYRQAKDNANYTADNIETLDGILSAGIIELESNRDPSAINSILENYKNLLDAVETIQDDNANNIEEALKEAIKSAIAELTNYPNLENYSDENLLKVNKFVNNYVAQISDATTKEDVENLLVEAKAAIDSIPTIAEEPPKPDEEVLTEVRENAIEDLNSFVAAISSKYSPEAFEQIKKIAEKAIEDINNSENADEIQKILEKAKADINEIPSASSEIEQELEAARANAEAQLKEYCDKDDYTEEGWNDIQTILDFYIDKLSKAPSVRHVNNIVNNAKSALDEVKTKAQLAEEEAWYKEELERAIARAKAEINATDLTIYREAEATVLSNQIQESVEKLDVTTKLEDVAKVVRYMHYAELSLLTDAEYTKIEDSIGTEFLQSRQEALLEIDTLNYEAYRQVDQIELKKLSQEYKYRIMDAKLPSELQSILAEWHEAVAEFKTKATLDKEESQVPIPDSIVTIDKDGDTGIDKEHEYYLYLNESNKDIRGDSVAESTSSTYSADNIRVTETVYTFRSGLIKTVKTTYNSDLNRKLIDIILEKDGEIVDSRTISMDGDVESGDILIDPDIIAFNEAYAMAKTTLDNIKLSDYREAQQKVVTQLIEETRAKLVEAKSKDAVDSIMNEFTKLLTAIPTDEKLSYEESESVVLAKAKEEANEKLDTLVNVKDYRDEEAKEIDKLISEAKEKVEKAEKVDEIDSIIDKVKEDISKLKTKATYEEEEKKAAEDAKIAEALLEKAKETAIQELKDSVSGKEYREVQATQVKSLLDEYTEKINKASTEEEVTKMKNEGIEALKAIDTHQQIVAKEQSDKTSKDKVDSTSDFNGKEDLTDGNTGKVKTGDVSPVVGLGITGGIAALAGAIFSIFKRKRK